LVQVAVVSGAEVALDEWSDLRNLAQCPAQGCRVIGDLADGGSRIVVQPGTRFQVVKQPGVEQRCGQLLFLGHRRAEVIVRQEEREPVKEEKQALHLRD
jgi:hypothetical protein